MSLPPHCNGTPHYTGILGRPHYTDGPYSGVIPLYRENAGITMNNGPYNTAVRFFAFVCINCMVDW